MTLSATDRKPTVHLLEADPDLGAQLSPAALAQALRVLTVPLLALPRGQWEPPALASGALGLLVLTGFLVRQVSLGPATSCELLGPGDVLRPWQNSLTDHLLPPAAAWRVIEPGSVAVIDRRASVLISRWPDLNAAIVARVARRAGCLAYLMTAQKFTRVEDRLLAALWHLAALWGRVRLDGVLIPFALTHQMLGELAGARRPSVTLALASLSDRELVTRQRGKRIVLHGDPPKWEQSRRRSLQPPA